MTHVALVHARRELNRVAADDVLGAGHDLHAESPAVPHCVAEHLPNAQKGPVCEAHRGEDLGRTAISQGPLASTDDV